MGIHVRYSCVSHIGLWRNENQDNFICGGRFREIDGTNCTSLETVCAPTPVVLGVFDGMGGEECGDIAAQIAAKKASEIRISKKPVADVRKYCTEANDAICRYMQENGIHSMGTTAAMLVFAKSRIVVFNIGDSKVFRVADGQINQISKDHIGVSCYGKKPPLYQNLGIPSTEMQIEPFVAEHRYHSGDVYLICSDGLTDMVPEKRIAEIVANTEFEKLAQELLNASLINGGKDNITIVVCEVVRKAGWFHNIFNNR